MKSYNITIIFMLVVLSAHAQQKKTWFIGMSTGLSAPVGEFAKADAGSFNHWNNKAGFGKAGVTAGIEGAYYFSGRMAVAGSVSFSEHGGFNRKDAAILSASYTDAFAVDESTVNTSGAYRSASFMAGPAYSLSLGKRLALDIRVMGGILKNISTPSMTVLLEDQTAATFRQLSSTASALGWQAGAGVRYALTSRTGLVLRGDYFQSRGVTIQNENRSNNAGRLVTRQPFAWINTTAGVYFRI